MRYLHGFFMSFGNFCAIPCPYRPWNEKARDLMLVFLPVVGLVIGFLWVLLHVVLQFLGLPMELSAALMAIYPFTATGFIHLDGFMDTSDAILSRRPLEDKLKILKDPHTGAFAIISVIILFLLCYSSMVVIEKEASHVGIQWTGSMIVLLLIPVVSRVGSALSVLTLKPLGHSQYHGKFIKRSTRIQAMVAAIMAIAALITAILLGKGQTSHNYNMVIVLLVGICAYALSMRYATRQLGGVSGDLAGYSLTIAEVCSVMAWAIVI